jgi:small subunit ribosomal protein S6
LAANVYEAMFILDTNRYGRDPAGVSGQIPALIQQLGGEVLANRLWEERRLAYPINGHRKGTYWLTYFKLDAAQMVQVRRQCQLNENIIRSLFLQVEPRIVDALVAHALTGSGSAVAEQRRAAKPETASILAPEELVGVDALADIEAEKSDM